MKFLIKFCYCLCHLSELGVAIFRQEHNKIWYRPPSRSLAPSDSRENTPLAEDHPEDDFVDYVHSLSLTFGENLKRPGRFSSGADPGQCDIVLRSTQQPRGHLSKIHFFITFDEH
jgi:hypothetical protein